VLHYCGGPAPTEDRKKEEGDKTEEEESEQ